MLKRLFIENKFQDIKLPIRTRKKQKVNVVRITVFLYFGSGWEKRTVQANGDILTSQLLTENRHTDIYFNSYALKFRFSESEDPQEDKI